MKIKCYDEYHKQWLYIIIGEYDDEILGWESSGPDGITIKERLVFQSIEGDKENCDPKRWSDLIDFEIVNK